MLLQARQNNKNQRFLIPPIAKMLKHKRGLSLVIGYILLVAISIVMSIIVYQWLKTYVPTESIECDEGTSIFISDISCEISTGELKIKVNNNGKFSVHGYFIYASDDPEAELATIDISSKIESGGDTYGLTKSITFSETEDNSLIPGDVGISTFDISEYGATLVRVEIIPTRRQEMDNKMRFVSCGNAKIEETFTCE